MSGHCFFKYSFWPFLFSFDSHNVYVGTLDCCPQGPLGSVHFFHSFFSSCFSGWIILISYLQFSDSFFYLLDMLLNFLRVFHFSYCTFWSRISIWFHFIISISLFTFCLYIGFLIYFSCLPMVSFCSKSIFKKVILKSLSIKFNIWASSQAISVKFFPMNGPYFLYLCMSCDFLLEIGHFKYYHITLEILLHL